MKKTSQPVTASKDKSLIEIVAKEMERESCKCYGWTPLQFDIWWNSVDKNIGRERKANRLRDAKIALKTLEKLKKISS